METEEKVNERGRKKGSLRCGQNVNGTRARKL